MSSVIVQFLGVAPHFCLLLFVLWLCDSHSYSYDLCVRVRWGLQVCVCLSKDLPLLFYTPQLFLVQPPPAGLLRGGDNRVMVLVIVRIRSGNKSVFTKQTSAALCCPFQRWRNVLWQVSYKHGAQERVGFMLWSEILGLGISECEVCALMDKKKVCYNQGQQKKRASI